MNRVFVFNIRHVTDQTAYVEAESYAEARALLGAAIPGDDRVLITDPCVETYRRTIRSLGEHQEP